MNTKDTKIFSLTNISAVATILLAVVTISEILGIIDLIHPQKENRLIIKERKWDGSIIKERKYAIVEILEQEDNK